MCVYPFSSRIVPLSGVQYLICLFNGEFLSHLKSQVCIKTKVFLSLVRTKWPNCQKSLCKCMDISLSDHGIYSIRSSATPPCGRLLSPAVF